MKTIAFSSSNAVQFYEQLEEAKARLVKLCERELDDGTINTDVSVVRYNMAREELKGEFPLEVIGMLDASGFINDILCDAENAWLRARKVRSMSYSESTKFVAWESKKGGKV